MTPERPLLRIRGLNKSYAAPVLVDVDLEIAPGEVHALVGANGAGKSTLSRIVSGLTERDSGTIELDGHRFEPRTKAEAEAAGVQMVMQELNLVDTLSVAENIYFNRLPRRAGFVSFRRLYEDAGRALAAVGLEDLDPARPVGRLGVGRKQLVEIAAALARPCRLLILDEPTAALTDPEIELLFEHIRRLKAEGVGIIYISHRMDEIRRIADRVTVLRDGRIVAQQSARDLSLEEIVRHMVGRRLEEARNAGRRVAGSVALRVKGLSRGSLVRDVHFEVRHGEILGLSGLVGSGRTETLRALFGADRPEAGRVFIGERPVRIRRPRDAVRAGIGMIPEDRKQHGLFLTLPVRVNTTMARLQSVARRGGWIDGSREAEVTEALSRRVDVRSHSIEQLAAELSGGNQQKVVIARWLLRECDVLLFDEPTRGIDIGARQLVYRIMDELTAQGKALVVVSSELRELTALCDRIAVMSDGRIVATFNRGEWTEEAITSAAFSGYLNRPSAHVSP